MRYCSGPWRDPSILKQLEQRFPSLPTRFLYFDINEADTSNLKVLEGMSIPSLPFNNDSNEDELVIIDKAIENEDEAFKEEIEQLAKEGVQVVE